VKQERVGAGDAAVGDVTDDGNLQVAEAALDLTNRQRIQQRLRRVLMHPVTGVTIEERQTLLSK